MSFSESNHPIGLYIHFQAVILPDASFLAVFDNENCQNRHDSVFSGYGRRAVEIYFAHDDFSGVPVSK